MDLIDELRALASRNRDRLDSLQTEEATKTALVMPFIRALGYDVFNPTEVVPEFTADVGTKKGEKVDYAIMRDGAPAILFECKTQGATLDRRHASQLFRYFTTTVARVGVLTDGSTFRFFSDLEAPNRMDERPFLTFNLFDFDEAAVRDLQRFTKSNFAVDELVEAARELKYTRGLKNALVELFDAPDDDFVRLLAPRVYSGRMTKGTVDQFRETIKRACREFLKDRINERFASAMEGDSPPPSAAPTAEGTTAPAPTAGATPAKHSPVPKPGADIVTTEDERAAFYAIKAMLHGTVDVHRVAMRDRKSYCGILLDDNNRKPICRLWFHGEQKYVGLIDAEKNVERLPVETVEDLYQYADRLRETAARYDA